jgi:hypothetical protein
MIKPDFQSMTTAQLRVYVLENREDEEAFYALSDRIRKGAKPLSLDELPSIIKNRQQNQEQQKS